MLDATATPNELSSPPTQKERLPHSRFGIISIRLTLYPIVVLLVFAIFDMHQVLSLLPLVIIDSLTVFCILGSFFAIGIAPIFGGAGLCEPRTRKIYAVLGSIISTTLFLALIDGRFLKYMGLVS